jgi:hypothetical protein
MGFVVQDSERQADGTLELRVRTDPSGASACPFCGAARHVAATRLSRFTDVPLNGHPVVLAWRRRHFTCRGCGRPSHETVTGLHDGRRVTSRLADWIAVEGAKRDFLNIARECGLSGQTVVTLFGAATEVVGVGSDVPRLLGLAVVSLAGQRRPVMVDVANASVIDVYRSMPALEDQLRQWSKSPPAVERLILDIELDPMRALLDTAFVRGELVVDPASAGRVATRMMLNACHDAIVASAKKQRLVVRTLEILFNKPPLRLGGIGQRRLYGSNRDPDRLLGRAHRLKDEFLEISRSWWHLKWDEWRREAKNLRELGAAGGPSVDYGPVIALIDRYIGALERYGEMGKQHRNYERRLAALAALPKTGTTRSFKGTRARVLQEFGDEGGVRREGARR